MNVYESVFNEMYNLSAGKHLKGQDKTRHMMRNLPQRALLIKWQHSEDTGLLDIKCGKTVLPIWHTSWTGFAAHFFPWNIHRLTCFAVIWTQWGITGGSGGLWRINRKTQKRWIQSYQKTQHDKWKSDIKGWKLREERSVNILLSGVKKAPQHHFFYFPLKHAQ